MGKNVDQESEMTELISEPFHGQLLLTMIVSPPNNDKMLTFIEQLLQSRCSFEDFL